MTDKEQYRDFCKKEKNIPIFSQDSVCGKNNWDVVIIERNNEIIASMPYIKQRVFIFDMLVMPKLTQNIGIYVKYPINQRYEKRSCSGVIV
jgi:hypothetical protein